MALAGKLLNLYFHCDVSDKTDVWYLVVHTYYVRTAADAGYLLRESVLVVTLLCNSIETGKLQHLWL